MLKHVRLSDETNVKICQGRKAEPANECIFLIKMICLGSVVVRTERSIASEDNITLIIEEIAYRRVATSPGRYHGLATSLGIGKRRDRRSSLTHSMHIPNELTSCQLPTVHFNCVVDIAKTHKCIAGYRRNRRKSIFVGRNRYLTDQQSMFEDFSLVFQLELLIDKEECWLEVG